MQPDPVVIEDQIEIAASADRVFEMVSEPGWWINDGAYTPHDIVRRDDGLIAVTDPTHGEFPLVVVSERPPSYVAFRWLARAGDSRPDGPGTLVEFWIESGAGGGVLLKVRESGFETLDESEADLLATIADNRTGWAKELNVAKTHLEA